MEDSYKSMQLIDHISAIVVILDQHGRVININKTCQEIIEYSLEDIKGKSFWEVFGANFKSNRHNLVDKSRTLDDPNHSFNCIVVNRSGKEVLIMWKFSYANEQRNASNFIIATGIGITKNIQEKKRIRSSCMHDSVTGLYNRAYFEEEMNRLENCRHFKPVGMIIGDVDGLKIINDTMGHQFGDEALIAMADIIKKCFRQEDFVARIGGDEFAIILPNTTVNILAQACNRIQEAIAVYNISNKGWPLSISLGYAIRESQLKTIKDLFKEADKSMYKQKHKSVSKNRRVLIDNLRHYSLFRNNISDIEMKLLDELLSSTANFLKISEGTKTSLELLARYHDIGTVGIPEKILKKQGKLSFDEYQEVQRHCELGFRIAWSVPELAPIAELILKHHEQWDGNGYPLGLKGLEIPLECRVFSVINSFISMTNHRPFRKALSAGKAVRELQIYSERKYDPVIVNMLIQLLGDF